MLTERSSAALPWRSAVFRTLSRTAFNNKEPVMMNLLIGLLTVVLVLDCLFLILLILIQLPKKDAGAGVAFGGGATDALFGAGSGTALTKITKYAATGFFVMALILSILQSNYHRGAGTALSKRLQAPAPLSSPPLT